MPYGFTITDPHNCPKDEILRHALAIAQEEIEEQGLGRNLLPQTMDFREEGKRKVYSFALMPSKKVSASTEKSAITVSP